MSGKDKMKQVFFGGGKLSEFFDPFLAKIAKSEKNILSLLFPRNLFAIDLLDLQRGVIQTDIVT